MQQLFDFVEKDFSFDAIDAELDSQRLETEATDDEDDIDSILVSDHSG